MVERLVDPSTGLQFRREDFRTYNTIWCRPPNNELTGAPYEHDALQHCAVHLTDPLRRERPRVVLAMGNQALRRATGQWGIDQLRGYYFKPTTEGFEEVELVIGTYHPSYIMRGKFNLARVFQLDLLKAVKAARGERSKRDRKYVLHPTVGDFQALIQRLKSAPGKAVAFDIETPYGDKEEKDSEFVAIEDDASYTILRISFSDEEGWGITAPWQEPFISLSREILALPNPKVSWNGTGFDVPRLSANGCVPEGLHYDSMHMWHALEPSLPMGLKYVATFYCPDMPPWKLQSQTSPEYYSAADSDVTICCYNGIRKALEEQGRWRMYERHFAQVDTQLRRMTRRGICVDAVKRTENRQRFEKRLEGVVSGVQHLIPLDKRPFKTYLYDEDRLRKQEMWEEGKMFVTLVPHTLKDNEEVVEGWVKRKPKPVKEGKKKCSRRKSTEPKSESDSTTNKTPDGLSPATAPSRVSPAAPSRSGRRKTPKAS